MIDDSVVPFGFPAICRKKVTAAFDGGRLTSDGGVLLLAQAERRMGIAGRLASCIADPRDQSRVVHGLGDILQVRMLAIASGYDDADDSIRCTTIPASSWRRASCPARLSASPANRL